MSAFPSHPQGAGDSAPREPLAVIGIGCRFPGGIDSPVAMWDALLGGRDAIREVPPDRWIHSRFHDTHPEKAGTIRNAKGGFIDGIDMFDADFFGYFPTEAQRLDPQQRLLLEVTHEAMEDAGIRRDQLDGSRTAVFIGSFMYDYLCLQSATEQRDEINPYVAMGTSMTALANRISYDFNLKGPSVSLDTACSSSLVAVHLACRSVWHGDADLAIAGGVNVMLRPETSILMSRAGFLSPDQYCKAFDASANGYVRSEGVGIVIVKPLRKALADGDTIYVVVRGSAVNQDGYLPEGFTVPNVFSQIALLQAAYADAGINPLTVDYVEAHGTGTPVGDPIESLALGAVLGRDRPGGQRCLMGSVKTNLGHLEGAAGIAGFIKAVLTAQHGIAAPNLHFHQPNPEIDWENLKLEVPTHPTPLEREGRPLTVGVNSFGAGGTNAHVVLQELPSRPSVRGTRPPSTARSVTAPIPTPPTLYVLSAAQRDALGPLALRHAEFLATTRHRLDDLAYSVFARRSHYPHLLAVVGQSIKEVAERLRQFADSQPDPLALAARVTRKKKPKLAFVFSGQGGQWARMGQQLMACEPVFRHALEEIDSYFEELAGWSLRAELARDAADTRIDETLVVQPAVMAIQIGLVKLYEHYGIRPRGVVGHSIGEVAAAFTSGALSLEDAARVIYHRSQAQNLATGKGGMLAVGIGADEARRLIDGHSDRVSIGAINGPEMLTLSGDPEPLARIAQLLESRGVFNRPVRVQVAYHSHHMEPIRERMLESLGPVRGSVATTLLYSTVTGRRELGTHLTADYWFKNARQPVLFTDALTSMLRDGYDTFIEVGPHPVLVGGAESLFQKRSADAVIGPAMTRREPEDVVFLQSLARLAARGLEPDTTVLFGPERRYVRVPKHPWQHRHYWFETPAAMQARRGAFEHPFLKRQTQLAAEEGLAAWDANIDPQKFPYLRDHLVDGELVFPATGHIELAWAVAAEQYRHEAFFLEDLQFDSPLILPDHSRHPLDVRLEIVSAEGDYRICTRSAEAARESPWSRHSSGRINTTHDRFDKSTAALDDLRRRFAGAEMPPVEAFYAMRRAAGLAYGDMFQCIRELRHAGHEVLSQLRLPDELLAESVRCAVHTALLDACLHVIFADAHRHGDPERAFLPFHIDRLRIYRRPTQTVWSHVRVTQNDEQILASDTAIFDEEGELIAEVLGLTCKRLARTASTADTQYDGCYEYRWVPAPRDTALHDRIADFTRAVLITDDSPLAAEMARRFTADGIVPLILSERPHESYDNLLADVRLDRRTLIVFAAGLSRRNEAVDPGWRGLGNCPAIPALLQLAQTLHRREGVPRLCIVTNGAAGASGDATLDLAQAVLHGMARVISNECPNIPLTVIDIGASIAPADVDALYEELLHSRRDRDESEVVLRGDQRQVRQLAPVERDTVEQAASTEEMGVGGDYRADLSEPGMLEQIVFRRLPPREPGEMDVEIAVHAAAMNFKDVMNAMGLLRESAVTGGLTGGRLGLEVAGRVLRVGARVRNVKVGDEVIARVPEGYCGRVITSAHHVVPKPEHLTPVEAAAIPLVYVTAWYSLCHLGRMARGETVLIHSAAGGVGGAAIQLVLRAGATVIGTAGTKEKRAYLRQMGVAHVFDSRTLEFYNQVMEVTTGRGVDVVLNSLTGRFVTQSLKCLAPFGRFIEIGKADVYRNSKLNLQRLGENISYFVVDVDRLAAQKPEVHREILKEVVALFERRELQPLEIAEFPISRLPDALKFMTRAAYRGKIVLNMQNDRVRSLPPRTAVFRRDRCYLVTGGASGFGLVVARWLVDRGAGCLVLVSRSGCKSDADRAVVAGMQDNGAQVIVVRADIADADACRQLMDRVKRELPPLAGVIHAAAVLDDASVPTMDMARFERVFAPKAQGAWNLHEMTQAAGAPLDFFVMLSSISSVLGLYGQLNYASANFFQDALAVYRRQKGLPATSVNLGVLGHYAGMSKAADDARDVLGLLESHGMAAMPLTDVLAKLEIAVIQQPVQRMAARFDWARFRAAYPHLVRDSRFIDLMSDAALARGSRPSRANLRTALAEMAPAPRRERLEIELTGALARVLDVPPKQLDVSASIDVLGLDSLMLTQIRNWILRALDVNLPLIKLLKGPSMATLAADLLTQLDHHVPDLGANSDVPHAAPVFALTDMEGVHVVNPWLIRGRGAADAPVRLICFHSMGVGASLFTPFLLNPPSECDVIAVQTPGRENRRAEPVMESVELLADQIVAQLLPLFDRPVVLWGHSFGGIVAWEVARRLRERHEREPLHFVVTGTIAPHLIERWQKREVILKSLIADNSPEYLISLSRYVDDPELLKAILPGLRRDYPLLKSCRVHDEPSLRCPITAFAARQDDVVYPDEIREWSQHTFGGFELIEVDGDHWFINRNRALITATLSDIAARARGRDLVMSPVH